VSSAPHAAPRSTPATEAWSYDVDAGTTGDVLDVVATFEPTATARFVVDDSADPFVDSVRVAIGANERTVAPVGAAWELPECLHARCVVKYRYLLGKAAERIDDVTYAARRSGVLLAPPSTWLLHPETARPSERYAFRVGVSAPLVFVTGVFPTRDGSRYGAEADSLGDAPYAAFGPLTEFDVAVPGGVVTTAIAPGSLDVEAGAIQGWIDRAAHTVADYCGRFPVARTQVIVVPDRGRWVNGLELGGGGAAVLFRVGRHVTARELDDDWVATHELFHTVLPSLDRRHQWFTEGLSTYAEPVARARAGHKSAESVWRELVGDTPKGQPVKGDRGLDQTPTWGRTYWGGAAFWLLVDVELRRRTQGRFGLPALLGALIAAGGTTDAHWPMERVLNVGDRAAGVAVLSELYQRYARSPAPFELDALWRELGIVLDRGTLRFDDRAALADVRRAITAPGR
jgi:hypothetical protein